METSSILFRCLFFSLATLFLSPISLSRSAASQEEAAVLSTDPSHYYKLCSNYSCGNTPLEYPFGLQSFCGHPDLKTTCVDSDHIVLSSNYIPESEPCRVIGNLSSDTAGITIPITFESLFGCGRVTRKNFVTDSTLFTFSGQNKVGLHLNCSHRPTSAPPGTLQPSSCLECDTGSKRGSGNLCFYSPVFNNYAECENFMLLIATDGRVINVSAIQDLRGFLRRTGCKIRYTRTTSCRSCESSGGRCGSSTRGDFVCFCPSSVHRSNCSDGMIEDLRTWLPRDRKHKISTGVIAGITVSVSLVVLIAIAIAGLLFMVRRKAETTKDDDERGDHGNFSREAEDDFNTLIDGISPTRYTYSQVKKFTSNFSVKLGEGGYGVVYKGFIEGTGAVAVKLLKQSEQSEKQFMNEVATVGRIHHHNLVRMLGYCARDRARALIYEFMEMGSLDKYNFYNQTGSEAQNKEDALSLTYQQFHNIAVETARGILYLHEGCRNRILHLDIKPHNVLLDSNMSAKVSDFGLARLIDEDCSHLSITHAQGTPGYAAPEMWSKAYGPITDKSDVYSYGMLLLDIVGRSKKSNSTDESIAEGILFKKPEEGDLKGKSSVIREGSAIETEELGRQKEVEEEEEEEILEKICKVGLWCIQHIPSNRPTMRKVIQMLEGSNHGVQIPTDPFPDESNYGQVFLNLAVGSSVTRIQSSTDK